MSEKTTKKNDLESDWQRAKSAAARCCVGIQALEGPEANRPKDRWIQRWGGNLKELCEPGDPMRSDPKEPKESSAQANLRAGLVGALSSKLMESASQEELLALIESFELPTEAQKQSYLSAGKEIQTIARHCWGQAMAQAQWGIAERLLDWGFEPGWRWDWSEALPHLASAMERPVLGEKIRALWRSVPMAEADQMEVEHLPVELLFGEGDAWRQALLARFQSKETIEAIWSLAHIEARARMIMKTHEMTLLKVEAPQGHQPKRLRKVGEAIGPEKKKQIERLAQMARQALGEQWAILGKQDPEQAAQLAVRLGASSPSQVIDNWRAANLDQVSLSKFLSLPWHPIKRKARGIPLPNPRGQERMETWSDEQARRLEGVSCSELDALALIGAAPEVIETMAADGSRFEGLRALLQLKEPIPKALTQWLGDERKKLWLQSLMERPQAERSAGPKRI